MGFARKNLGIDITGGGARRAAESASRNLAGAGREAISGIQSAASPFSALGVQAGGQLGSFLQQDQPQLQDPSQIINNPFFQALSQDLSQNTLAQRAALGLGGSGGTQDALARQQLLLGNQFQQQDFRNQQSQQQNRFNQLLGVTQFGAGIGTDAARQTGNLLTGVANAENVGIQAKSAQQSALGGQVLQFAGDAFKAFAGGAGGGAGSLLSGGGAAGVGQIGAAAAGVGSGASGLAGFSDKRLKRDIKKIDSDGSGNIYKFKYIDSDVVYIGRMANELQEIRPDAVSLHKSGYLQVSEEFQSRVA